MLDAIKTSFAAWTNRELGRPMLAQHDETRQQGKARAFEAGWVACEAAQEVEQHVGVTPTELNRAIGVINEEASANASLPPGQIMAYDLPAPPRPGVFEETEPWWTRIERAAVRRG